MYFPVLLKTSYVSNKDEDYKQGDKELCGNRFFY